MTESDPPRESRKDTPLTPEVIAALEAMRLAPATGDASDSMVDHPVVAKLLAETEPALREFDRVTEAAIEGFDAESARYAIEQRCRADAMLWRTARWAFPVFLLSAAGIELVRAASQHRSPEVQAILFPAVAALIGMAFLMSPMLRRRQLALQALRQGPLELQVNFERMRRSSRNQRVLFKACLVFGGLGGLMVGIMAAVEGRWFVALCMVMTMVCMAMFARRHRAAHDEAFFAGRMSAEDWLLGPGTRKRT